MTLDTPSYYRAGYVENPKLTSLTLLKQAVKCGVPVSVHPINDVVLGDETIIVELHIVRTKLLKHCPVTSTKVVAIFQARIDVAGFITEVLE